MQKVIGGGDLKKLIREIAPTANFKGRTAADIRVVTGKEVTDEWDRLMPLVNKLGDRKTLKVLGELSTDADPKVRRTVISTLDTVAEQTPAGKSRDILKDPISQQAIGLLKQRVDRESDPEVLKHLHDTFDVFASMYQDRVGILLSKPQLEKLGFSEWS